MTRLNSQAADSPRPIKKRGTKEEQQKTNPKPKKKNLSPETPKLEVENMLCLAFTVEIIIRWIAFKYLGRAYVLAFGLG